MVRTPLWTDRPEKMAEFGYSVDASISAEDVANGMIKLVTDGQYPGGTSLETSNSGERTLGIWNVEAPAAIGTSVPRDFVEKNQAPIKAILNKERSLL